MKKIFNLIYSLKAYYKEYMTVSLSIMGLNVT